MKKEIILTVLTFFALNFASCSQEESPPSVEEQTLSIIAYSISEESGTNVFTDDFTLELWSGSDDSCHEKYRMTHDGIGWNTIKTNLLPATVLAYRGKTVIVTSSGDYQVRLTEDQREKVAFQSADVMIATGTVDSTGPLLLHFEHYYAKVTFNVTLAGEFESGEQIENFYVKVYGQNVPEVLAYKLAENRYSAYIPAYAYSPNENLAGIVIGDYTEDNKFDVSFPESITLEAGKHYEFDLMVGKDKEPTAEGQSIVFVEGVTRESGWYDVNKVGKGDNGDINMCWAAAASNIIQWWQDRYVAAGNSLPSQAVTGAGQTYELALMEVFHQQWDNYYGGQVAEAIPWYFEGVYYGETVASGTQAYPLSKHSGGYFKDVWEDIYPHLYHEYTYMLGMYKDLYVGEYNNYYLWGNGSNLQGEERLKYFTQLVVDFVNRGIASLTISLSSNLQTLHHATTIWGYEIDHSTGVLTRLWITDSDDLETEPKEPLLNEYTVSIGDGNSHIKLSSNEVRYGACYVVSLIPVSGYK